MFIASGDGGDFGDFFVVAFDFFGDFVDAFNDFGTGFFDAFSEVHWTDASGDELVGFVHDIVSQDCDGGSAVAGDFVEFLGGGFDEFGADLFAKVFVGGS